MFNHMDHIPSNRQTHTNRLIVPVLAMGVKDDRLAGDGRQVPTITFRKYDVIDVRPDPHHHRKIVRYAIYAPVADVVTVLSVEKGSAVALSGSVGYIDDALRRATNSRMGLSRAAIIVEPEDLIPQVIWQYIVKVDRRLT